MKNKIELDPSKKLSDSLTFKFQFAVDRENVQEMIHLCYAHDTRVEWGKFYEARLGAEKRTWFNMTVETFVDLRCQRKGLSRELSDIKHLMRIMSMK